jgi:ELWxxDGT repeat protein
MAAKPYTFGCALAAALALAAATLVAAAPPANAVGARPVTDFHSPGLDHEYPRDLTRVGQRLFFEVDDGIHGGELWRTNGTRRGTRLVRNIGRGDESSDPDDLTNVNGTLFFTAKIRDGAETLWRSDGTRAGTRLVPGLSGQLRQLTAAGGTLFFVFDDGTHGRELWRSDGTEAGTGLVSDIRPGTKGSAPGGLTYVGGTLFFAADDGTHGEELWRSDGTEAGSSLVREINPGDSFLDGLTNIAGTLFFNAYDGAQFGLWRSDGTPEGTTPVLPFAADEITDVEGTLFFRAYDSVHGSELWRSDGTEAGTSLVRDIKRPGSGTARFHENQLTAAGGTLFFEAGGDGHGRELWRSDGTRAGTRLVRDIAPGRESSRPDWITSVGRSVFFVPYIDSPLRGHAELWKTGP